jgi:hypothetical protein
MNRAIITVVVLAVISVPALGTPFDDAMAKCDAGPTPAYKQCVDRANALRKEYQEKEMRSLEAREAAVQAAVQEALKAGISQQHANFCRHRPEYSQCLESFVKSDELARRPGPQIE